MENFVAFMLVMYLSLWVGELSRKSSIGATIEYSIQSKNGIENQDVSIIFHYRLDTLKLDDRYIGEDLLHYTIRDSFWYPPGRFVIDKEKCVLYLYTPGENKLYPQFFFDSMQIVNHLSRNGIRYCTRRRGIWTDEMLEAEEVKIIDSKKCKDG